jgi:hypothetical protein
MRVDDNSEGGSQVKTLAFDNMGDRPLKGTFDWRKEDVVLDVPAGGTGAFFGILLSGTGTVWLNNRRIEEVGNDVAVTGKPKQPANTAPVNLNFEQ